MGQFEDFRVFVAIVEANGIARAADKLGIAKSAVSRRLGLLEERYAARLIDRNPGTWEVTQTGQELYQRSLRVVSDAEEIEAEFKHPALGVSGPLTVSVAAEFGLAFLTPALLGFKNRHPEIQLTVDFDDRRVDLDRENYDFAIRISEGTESGLVEKRMGRCRHQLYASPKYLETAGVPESLDELRNHSLLHFGAARRATWELHDEAGRRSVDFQPALNSNSGQFLLEAALGGMGIARLPDFIASSSHADGKLVQVLPKAKVAEWGISLVHSAKRRLNRRMRLFCEEMMAACSTQPTLALR